MNTWDYKKKMIIMIITIKGKTKENTDSFSITTDAAIIAAETILKVLCEFDKIENNMACYLTAYDLEISEDISNKLCFIAKLDTKLENLNGVIIRNYFGGDDLVFKIEKYF